MSRGGLATGYNEYGRARVRTDVEEHVIHASQTEGDPPPLTVFLFPFPFFPRSEGTAAPGGAAARAARRNLSPASLPCSSTAYPGQRLSPDPAANERTETSVRAATSARARARKIARASGAILSGSIDTGFSVCSSRSLFIDLGNLENRQGSSVEIKGSFHRAISLPYTLLCRLWSSGVTRGLASSASSRVASLLEFPMERSERSARNHSARPFHSPTLAATRSLIARGRDPFFPPRAASRRSAPG